MKRFHSRWAMFIASALACLTGLLLATPKVQSQPGENGTTNGEYAGAIGEVAGANQSRFTYLGLDGGTCRRCHRGPTEDDREQGFLDRINLNEYVIWHGQAEGDRYGDVHSKTYAVLIPEGTQLRGLNGQGGERLNRMQQLLGITAASDLRCLSCHALTTTTLQEPATEEARLQQHVFAKDGVSCESCHGPANDWRAPHSTLARLPNDQRRWRDLTPKQKEGWGMYNVWDVTKRAQLCLSCHLGDAKQGRIVTHDMYAAGHPVLPGMEVETLAKLMPRHRKNLAQKTPEAQRQFDYHPGDMFQTREVVSGGLTTLRETIRLVADEANLQRGWSAANKNASQYPKSAWPELSLYDCSACHHDLPSPGWRQARGYTGNPGQPMLRVWPTALAQLGMVAIDKDPGTLQTLLVPLDQAINARPYGNREEVAEAAQTAVKELDSIIEQLQQLQGQRYDRPLAVKLLRAICRLGQAEVSDFDSARQWARAFKIVYEEFYEAVLADYQDRRATPPPAVLQKNSVIQGILTTLTGELLLTSDSRSDPESAKLLEAASRFEPQEFKKQLGLLQAQLGAGQ